MGEKTPTGIPIQASERPPLNHPLPVSGGSRVGGGQREGEGETEPGRALTTSAAAGRPGARALYIHVPFCGHKCHYCDFYSFVDTRDQQGAFVERLIGELAALSAHAREPSGERAALRSVFVGGGTPSLLRVDLWERLLGALHERFDLSLMQPGRDGAADGGVAPGEFTVECNPESTTDELLGLLASRGVNRVSVGAQSFEARHLKTLERWHDPENVQRAIEAARRAGIPRQSVDLIFAIPGQTLEEWGSDLRRALALQTTHVSCYNLTYEPNTAMTARLRAGEFAPVDEDLEAEMFDLTLATMRGAGLARYEVSNFAAIGHESRHNLAYWRQEQWLAAGPSASAHVWAGPTMRAGSWRWKNVARLGDYLASGGARGGLAPVVDVEPPDPVRLVRERLMMGLRLEEGIDAAGLLADLRSVGEGGEARAESLLRAARRVEDRGQLVCEAATGRWRLTDAGMMLGDAIAGELMRAV